MASSRQKCGNDLRYGKCSYPSGHCPIHDDLSDTPPPPEAPPAAADPAKRKERPSTRTLARDALEAVSANAASPTLATRFVHALRATEAMGEEPETLQESAQMAALIGGIGHGIPPRDREQWELLEQMHDNYTLQLVYRWYPWTWFDDIRLDKLIEPAVQSQGEAWDLLLEERKEWGEKHPGWEDDDVLSDPPPWRVRIRSKHDHRRPPGPPKQTWGSDPYWRKAEYEPDPNAPAEEW